MDKLNFHPYSALFCAPSPSFYGNKPRELKAIKRHIWPITQHAMVSKLNLFLSGPGSTSLKSAGS